MHKLYTISQAAKLVNMTTETLRHYDRVDLLKPCYIDPITSYRYYSNDQIVYLNTIQALRYMDMSLEKIKEILTYNEPQKIINLLKETECLADEKILHIGQAKQKITKARKFYESKINVLSQHVGVFTRILPERVILLSNHLTAPSLDNLWNYHRHFYQQLSASLSEKFVFDDIAGVYIHNSEAKMFAVCLNYEKAKNLQILPAGKYLCINCQKQDKPESLLQLVKHANAKYHIMPNSSLEIITLTGILQWSYQLQVYIGNK